MFSCPIFSPAFTPVLLFFTYVFFLTQLPTMHIFCPRDHLWQTLMLYKLWLHSSSLTTQEKTVPLSDSLRIYIQLRDGFSKIYFCLMILQHLFGAQTYFPGCNSLRKDLPIRTPPKLLSTASYSTHLKCKSLPEAKANTQSRSPQKIYFVSQGKSLILVKLHSPSGRSQQQWWHYQYF